MIKKPSFATIFLLSCLTFFIPPTDYLYAGQEKTQFQEFLDQLHVEALEQGISEQTVALALKDIQAPKPKTLHHYSNQPEVKLTLERYLRNQIDQYRIRDGRQKLETYPTWLSRIERKYGVPRTVLVALWGIESHYGKNTGDLPLVQSLVTLAYEGRRTRFFKKELFAALQLVDDGVVPFAKLRGSWAGAMGQFQFMPSSVRNLAVDEDHSGSIDLWRSFPDALGSAAHFLDRAGWVRGQRWGRRVTVPAGFDSSKAGLSFRQPLSYWRKFGIKTLGGADLPRSAMEASLIMPDGPQGRAYLVYQNFRVLMRWNRSQLFAITVGELANSF